jgi:thiamine-phosphate pyrophosphorylase
MDRSVCRRPAAEAVEAAVAAGVDWLQIRERALEDRELLAWARELVQAAQRGARSGGRPLRVLVNRRLDLALALRADGVHLGRGAVTVADARALLASGKAGAAPSQPPLVGVSAHGLAEVEAAARAGADYVQLAPVFDPRSKAATRSALGVDDLRRASALRIPVLAQGGVDGARCDPIIAAGAAGVAVTGAILMADDPGRAAGELRRALDTAQRQHARKNCQPE